MDDVVLRLILRDEFKATLQSYKSELDKATQESKRAAGEMSSGFANFGKGLATVAAGFGAYEIGAKLATSALAALRAVTVGAVDEFNSDERAARMLGVALTNLGHAADKQRLVEYASALQELTGKTDDSIIGVETYFASLGNTAAQIERMTKLTLNMAPVFGSVEGAMRAVERATNGEVAGLSRLGISFTEAEKSGKDIEGVLRKLEAATAGQGEAAKTASEGLARSFENLQGAIGRNLAPAVKSMKQTTAEWIDSLADGITKVNRMSDAVDNLTEAELRLESMRLEREKAQAGTLGHFDTDIAAVNKRLAEVNERMKNLAFFRGERRWMEGNAVDDGHFPNKPTAGDAKTDKATPGSMISVKLEQAALARDAAAEKLKEETEAFLSDVDQLLAERAAEIAADRESVALQAAATREGGYMAAPAAQFTAEEQAAMTANALAIRKADTENQLATEKATSALDAFGNQITNGFDDVARGASVVAKAQDENARALQAHTAMLDMAAAAGQGLASVVYAIGSGGNVESALAGMAAQSASAGATSMATSLLGAGTMAASFAAPVVGAVAGTAVTMLADSLFGGPNTQGGKDRAELSGVMTDFGFTTITQMERSLLEASGQADIWQTWAESIVGSEAIGQGGEILAGSFNELGISMSEAATAVGAMVAANQGLSRSEADMAVAQQALLSNSVMTADELSSLALMYADNASYLEEESRLREQILADAKAYAATGGNQSSAEFATLQADRNAYVGMMASQYAEQQAADAATMASLVAGGMSEADARNLVNANKSVESNTATMIEQNNVMIGLMGGTPPPDPGNTGKDPGASSGSTGGYSGAGWNRGQSSSVYGGGWMSAGRSASYGGGTTNHIYISGVVGNENDVARKIHRSLSDLQRQGMIR